MSTIGRIVTPVGESERERERELRLESERPIIIFFLVLYHNEWYKKNLFF
jgi:hypothetical protein